MPRSKRLSPIEIAKIRKSLPYLKRHVDLPDWLLAAVGQAARPPKIGKHEIRRLIAALMDGPKLVALNGKKLVIGGKRGPGRPPGSRNRQGASKRASKRIARVSAKQAKARKLQGRYMGVMRGLTGDQKAAVKKAKAESGYTAAFAAASKFGR